MSSVDPNVSVPQGDNTELTEGLTRRESLLRSLFAVLTGLIGVAFVVVATPLNNYLIANPYIADSFLPAAALFPLLVLVLGLNPLLRWVRPKLAFTPMQLTMIYAMMVAACVPISSGFLRFVPYGIAATTATISQDQMNAEVFPSEELPPSLFPDAMQLGTEASAAQGFLLDLSPGESIPWEAWIGPLLAWGTFALLWWTMMTGLALLVFPQWRRNERLAFPLVSVLRALVEAPREGKLLGPLFRNRWFWIGTLSVLLIHILSGLKQYDQTLAPAIPLAYNITPVLTEEPLVNLPEFVKLANIYFVFLGVAFLMSTRISFSIWAFAIINALYIMLGVTYVTPFYASTVVDYRMGATLAFALGVIWLGRAHWVAAVRSCFEFHRATAEAWRDRIAVLLLSGGFLGIVGWQLWAGAQLPVALIVAAYLFIFTLIVTRIVAETGLALIGIDGDQLTIFLKYLPVEYFTRPSVWVGEVLASVAGQATRTNWGALLTNLFGMDEETGARGRLRMAGICFGVLAAALVVGGAVHLWMNYNYGISLNGRDQPVNVFGTEQLRGALGSLTQHDASAWDTPPYNRIPHLLFGMALAGGLLWLCLAMPRFPFHPVGLILIGTWYMHMLWVSVFLGWLLKVMIVRYGGARLYSKAKPLFFGVIVGEIFGMVFWVLVSVLMIQLGRPYTIIPVIPF